MLLRQCLQAVHAIPGHRFLLQLLPATLGHYAVAPSCAAEAKSWQQQPARQQPAAPPQQSGGQLQLVRPLSSSPEPAASLMTQLLGNNQFASGGLFLMVLGAAAATARLMLDAGLKVAWRQLVITAEVDSRDDAYRWLMHWLAQHSSISRSRAVSVTTAMSAFGTSALPPGAVTAATDAATPSVHYLPAPGDHVLRYKGCWVWVRRQRASGNPQLASNARLLMETLHLTLFSSSRALLEQLLADAAAAYASSTRNRTVVHSVDADGYWTQVGSRPIRPLSTVVLPQGQAEALQNDCLEFLASEEWYAHHGIPYRRGYLLYGIPGSGKTSLVMALAGALGLDIYVVTLSSPAMSDETLRSLLNAAEPKSLLLLEDVDAAFVERQGEGAAARLTFSGLLNAIDGVAAQEGRLLFMTTNHIERLAPALIRPGRVDVRCAFGAATRQQAHDLFVSFYADMPPAAAASVTQAGLDGGAAAVAAVAAAAGTGPGSQAQRELGGERRTPPIAPAGSGPHSAGGAPHKAAAAGAGAGAGAGAEAACLTRQDLLRLAQQFAAALPLEHLGSANDSGSSHAPAVVAVTQPQAPQPGTVSEAAEAVASGQEKETCSEVAVEGVTAGISMAALQGHLMSYKRDPWGAVAHAGQLSSAGAGKKQGVAVS